MKGPPRLEHLRDSSPRLHEWTAERFIVSGGSSSCFVQTRTPGHSTEVHLRLTTVFNTHRHSPLENTTHLSPVIMNTHVSPYQIYGGMVRSPVSCNPSALGDDWCRNGHAPEARPMFTAAYPPGLHRTASVAGSIFGVNTEPVCKWPDIYIQSA
jgi:hypothetical protein